MANIQLLAPNATLQNIMNAINQIIAILRDCPCPCDCDCKKIDCNKECEKQGFKDGGVCIKEIKDCCICAGTPNNPPSDCDRLICRPPNVQVVFRIFNLGWNNNSYVDMFAQVVNKMGGQTCCKNATGFGGIQWGFPCGISFKVQMLM